MKSNNDIVDHFCSAIDKFPELFLFLSEGQVYHTGSQIFYDSESGAFGRFTYSDDYDPDIVDSDSTGMIKDISYISVSNLEFESLHKAYLQWFGWYNSKKNEKLLDTAKEMFINNNYEDI